MLSSSPAVTTTRSAHHDDIRVRCIARPKDDRVTPLPNERLLLPDNLTASQLVHTIRKRIKMQPDKGIFVFCNGTIVTGMTTARQMLDQHGDEDGVLRVHYATESVFG